MALTAETFWLPHICLCVLFNKALYVDLLGRGDYSLGSAGLYTSLWPLWDPRRRPFSLKAWPAWLRAWAFAFTHLLPLQPVCAPTLLCREQHRIPLPPGCPCPGRGKAVPHRGRGGATAHILCSAQQGLIRDFWVLDVFPVCRNPQEM